MQRALSLLPLLGIAACAQPVAAPTAEATPPPMIATTAGVRMTRTLNQTVAIVPLAPRPPADDTLPLPNRAIEPPRSMRADSLNPTLEPMLLPNDPRQGVTFGGEHLRETGAYRPFEGLVPGARLRIPFE